MALKRLFASSLLCVAATVWCWFGSPSLNRTELERARVLATLERTPEREIDSAVRTIDSMAKNTPADALWQSKAAEIHLRRSRIADDPRDLILALEYAQTALGIDPFLVEAHETKASILGELGLWQEALITWDDYLMLEGNSANRQVAASRKAEIFSYNVRESRTVEKELAELINSGERIDELALSEVAQVQRFAIEKIPGLIGGALAARETEEVDAWLEAIETIGRIAEETTGDPFLAEVARDLDAVKHERDLSPALSKFTRGVASYGSRDIKSAKADLVAARRYFVQKKISLVHWVDFLLLGCAHNQNSAPDLEEKLAAFADFARNRNYLALQASASWLFGIRLVDFNRVSEGRKLYRTALELFRRVGWRDSAGFIELLLSDVAMLNGSSLEAWRLLKASLLSTAHIDPAKRQVVWAAAAGRALELSAKRSARILADRSISMALRSRRAVAIVEALQLSIQVRALSGDEEGALADLRRAERYLAQFPEGGGLRARAQFLVAVGRYGPNGNVLSRMADLDRGIELFRRIGTWDLLPGLLLARARIGHPRKGIDQQNEADLAEAASLLESQILEPLDLEQKNALIEIGRDVFEQWIRCRLVANRRPLEILELVERFLAFRRHEKRARPLPDPTALPLDTAVITHFVLPEKLLVWVATSEGLTLIERDVERSELIEAVLALREALERGTRTAFERTSSAVWDDLVEPIGSRLEGHRHLVFQIDPFLGSVPLAALSDSRGRFLVEDYTLQSAPRWPLLLVRRSASPRRSALILGNPTFDKEEFPAYMLDLLDGAQAEAEGVARLYPQAKILLESDATPEAFVDSLTKSFDVVHVASHLVWKSRAGDMPQLVLAKGANGSALTAQQIYQSKFRAPPLVYLAACDSAARGTERSRRFPSLAELFLDHGAMEVVGSLVELPDEQSGQVAEEFHHRYRQGDQPAEIMQALQSKRLRAWQSGPPWWCALQVEIDAVFSE